jgi:hydroxymethylglutaryl-CoA synthase
MKIGIEAISFDIPAYYVDMKNLAAARGVEPGKYIVGLGQKEMAVATPCEDTVVLAASAGNRLLSDFDVDKDSISLLVSGTETGVDHSKPVASYVHGLLGLSSTCRVFEVKHACYGAMAGIGMAINYILSGKARGGKALIIASDVARYGKNTAGEPTQGAGAVAMLISDKPTLFEFDYAHEGFFAKQVMDFWRPLYSKEAFADGHYSIQCYLEALSGAYNMFKASAMNGTAAQQFSHRFDACLYHVPFVKMAFKAHQRLLEEDMGAPIRKDTEAWQTLLSDYERRVEPALSLNARVGNIYTGALFLCLANLLKNLSANLEGKSVSLFSYGSGCGAEFMSGTVAKGAYEAMQKSTSWTLLENRKEISAARYEEILDACASMDLNNQNGICDAERWHLDRSIIFTGVQDHKRIYSYEGVALGHAAAGSK